MSEVDCCADCAFMGWDDGREVFFCGRNMECRAITPRKSVCPHGVRKVYRKAKRYVPAYQLNLMMEGKKNDEMDNL